MGADDAWTNMWTDSFHRLNRFRIYSKRLGDGIQLAVNTHIELNIATWSPVAGSICSVSASRTYVCAKFEEGVKQFGDRDYCLTGVPEQFIGSDFFQGPCHHNEGDELI